MHIAATISYGPDKDAYKRLYQAHRAYLRAFLDNGQLRAAGPFAENAGALWIIEADTLETAETIVSADPFVAAGVIVDWKLQPLNYWSAQEATAAR